MYKPFIVIILFITRKNGIASFLTIQQQSSSLQYSPLTRIATNNYNSIRINVRYQNVISSKKIKTILNNNQSYHTQSPPHPSPHPDHNHNNPASLSQNDIISINRQLGYTPPNIHSISARRRSTSLPLVIKTYPLGGGAAKKRRRRRRLLTASQSLTPFPTLYWLCCPEISRAISDLERRGYVRLLEDSIRKSEQMEDMVERMMVCHEVYARDRWMTLTTVDREMLVELCCEEKQQQLRRGDVVKDDDDDGIKMMISPRFVEVIRDSGVAGMDYRKIDDDSSSRSSERCLFTSIKCLHAHYAHYCSQIAAASAAGGDVNLVGEMVHEILRDQFPELDLELMDNY